MGMAHLNAWKCRHCHCYVSLFVPQKLCQNGHFNRRIDFTKTCCKPLDRFSHNFETNLCFLSDAARPKFDMGPTYITNSRFSNRNVAHTSPLLYWWNSRLGSRLPFQSALHSIFFGWHMLSSPIFVHQNDKTMRLGDQTLGNQPIHQNLLTLLKIKYPSPCLPILGIAVGSRWLYTALYSHVWANQNQPCSKLD